MARFTKKETWEKNQSFESEAQSVFDHQVAEITSWGQGFVPADWPETERERQAKLSTHSLQPTADSDQTQLAPDTGSWGQGFVPADWPETERERHAKLLALPPQTAEVLTQTPLAPDAASWGQGFVPADWPETERERWLKTNKHVPQSPVLEEITPSHFDPSIEIIPQAVATDADQIEISKQRLRQAAEQLPPETENDDEIWPYPFLGDEILSPLPELTSFSEDDLPEIVFDEDYLPNYGEDEEIFPLDEPVGGEEPETADEPDPDVTGVEEIIPLDSPEQWSEDFINSDNQIIDDERQQFFEEAVTANGDTDVDNQVTDNGQEAEDILPVDSPEVIINEDEIIDIPEITATGEQGLEPVLETDAKSDPVVQEGEELKPVEEDDILPCDSLETDSLDEDDILEADLLLPQSTSRNSLELVQINLLNSITNNGEIGEKVKTKRRWFFFSEKKTSPKIPLLDRPLIISSLRIMALCGLILNLIGTIVLMTSEGITDLYIQCSIMSVALLLTWWLGPGQGGGRYLLLLFSSLLLFNLAVFEYYGLVSLTIMWGLVALLMMGADVNWLKINRPLGEGKGARFLIIDEAEPSLARLRWITVALGCLATAMNAFYFFGYWAYEHSLPLEQNLYKDFFEFFIYFIMAFVYVFLPMAFVFILAFFGKRRAIYSWLGSGLAISTLLFSCWIEYALSNLHWATDQRLIYAQAFQSILILWLFFSASAVSIANMAKFKIGAQPAYLLTRSRNIATKRPSNKLFSFHENSDKLVCLMAGTINSPPPIHPWRWVATSAVLAVMVTVGLLVWGEYKSDFKVAPARVTEEMKLFRFGELELKIPTKIDINGWKMVAEHPGGEVSLTEIPFEAQAVTDGRTDHLLAGAVEGAMKARQARAIDMSDLFNRQAHMVVSQFYDSSRPNSTMMPNGLVLTLFVGYDGGYVVLAQSQAFEPLDLAVDNKLNDFINHSVSQLADWAVDYLHGYRWQGPNAELPDSGYKTQYGLFSTRPEGLGIRAHFISNNKYAISVGLHSLSSKGFVTKPYPHENIILSFNNVLIDYIPQMPKGNIEAAQLIKYTQPTGDFNCNDNNWVSMGLEAPDQAPLQLSMKMLSHHGFVRGEAETAYLLGIWEEIVSSLRVVPQGWPLGQGMSLQDTDKKGLPSDQKMVKPTKTTPSVKNLGQDKAAEESKSLQAPKSKSPAPAKKKDKKSKGSPKKQGQNKKK